jgi:molecular chaperone Hsp33
MPDHLIRAMLPDLNIRLVAALTTELSRDAATRHKASPAASCALSRGLTAGLLLATLSKSEERVTLQILANGPLKGLTVDAYGDGLVRGYPVEPQGGLEASAKMAKRQRLADLIGRQGVVNVVRDVGLRDRYQGQVELVTSEVDEDVEAYLRDSEQIPSAVGCEVVMDETGAIASAGGLLAQIMPDSPPQTRDHLRELQHALRTGELYDLLKTAPPSAEALLQLAARSLSVRIIDERPLRFQCRCDLKRIEAMVGQLETVELDGLIAEGKAEITCNYCGAVYNLSQEDLLRLREQRPPREQQ